MSAPFFSCFKSWVEVVALTSTTVPKFTMVPLKFKSVWAQLSAVVEVEMVCRGWRILWEQWWALAESELVLLSVEG